MSVSSHERLSLSGVCVLSFSRSQGHVFCMEGLIIERYLFKGELYTMKGSCSLGLIHYFEKGAPGTLYEQGNHRCMQYNFSTTL